MKFLFGALVVTAIIMPGLSGATAAATDKTIQGAKGTPLTVNGTFQNGKNKKRKCNGTKCKLLVDQDISAALCLADGYCVAGSDEARFVQEFTLSGASLKVGKRRYLAKTDGKQERKHKAEELDIEALASDGKGIFAVGSHSFRRLACEKQSSRHSVFYYEVPRNQKRGGRKPVTVSRFSLDALFRDSRKLAPHFDVPLQANGLNIEGAAVADKWLHIGLRAPYSAQDPNRGYIVSLDSKAAARGKVRTPKVHELIFETPGQGIRALEPWGKGLLVLTGNSGPGSGKKSRSCPKLERTYEGNLATLYYWDGKQPKLQTLARFAPPDPDWKAEGIMLDPERKKASSDLDVIIFFDGPKNGAPHRYTVARPES